MQNTHVFSPEQAAEGGEEVSGKIIKIIMKIIIVKMQWNANKNKHTFADFVVSSSSNVNN